MRSNYERFTTKLDSRTELHYTVHTSHRTSIAVVGKIMVSSSFSSSVTETLAGLMGSGDVDLSACPASWILPAYVLRPRHWIFSWPYFKFHASVRLAALHSVVHKWGQGTTDACRPACWEGGPPIRSSTASSLMWQDQELGQYFTLVP